MLQVRWIWREWPERPIVTRIIGASGTASAQAWRALYPTATLPISMGYYARWIGCDETNPSLGLLPTRLLLSSPPYTLHPLPIPFKHLRQHVHDGSMLVACSLLKRPLINKVPFFRLHAPLRKPSLDGGFSGLCQPASHLPHQPLAPTA